MYQFSDKTDNFEFLGPILSINGVWCQNSKYLPMDSENKRSIRHYVQQFSEKQDNFDFLGANFPKNEFWGETSKNLSLDSESASLRCYVYQFSDKTNNFEFFDPNLPKNIFLGSKFQKAKSGFGIDTSNIPRGRMFSQNGQLLIFGLNLGKLPNYVQYFGSNIVEGVA